MYIKERDSLSRITHLYCGRGRLFVNPNAFFDVQNVTSAATPENGTFNLRPYAESEKEQQETKELNAAVKTDADTMKTSS